MDGEMHVEAECWMNILDALDDNDIKMYVDNEYRPGLLNPFHKWWRSKNKSITHD